jgi:hypothetical protein
VLHLGILEDDGFLDPDTRADVNAGADGDVGADLGGGVDGGSGVDVDGREDVGGRRGELIRAILPRLLEVQGVGGDSGAGSLDLAPEVLGLVYEELLAIGEVA